MSFIHTPRLLWASRATRAVIPQALGPPLSGKVRRKRTLQIDRVEMLAKQLARRPLVKFFTIGLAGTLGDSHAPGIVRPMTASVPFFTFLLGLSACGPRLANRNIDALNAQFESAEKSGKSLSVKEVEAILGHPTREEHFPIEMKTTKELQGLRYYYTVDGHTVELHFIDNKLVRRSPRLGEAAGESDRRMMPKAMPATPEPPQ